MESVIGRLPEWPDEGLDGCLRMQCKRPGHTKPLEKSNAGSRRTAMPNLHAQALATVCMATLRLVVGDHKEIGGRLDMVATRAPFSGWN